MKHETVFAIKSFIATVTHDHSVIRDFIYHHQKQREFIYRIFYSSHKKHTLIAFIWKRITTYIWFEYPETVQKYLLETRVDI